MSQGLECKKIIGTAIGVIGVLGFITASAMTIKDPSSMGLNQEDPAYYWKALGLITECGIAAAAVVLSGFALATYPANPVPVPDEEAGADILNEAFLAGDDSSNFLSGTGQEGLASSSQTWRAAVAVRQLGTNSRSEAAMQLFGSIQ